MTYPEGIDVSLYQGDITSAVGHLAFCIVKVSQSGFVDPAAAAHFAQAKGKVLGAYHWLDPTPTAEAQAQNFLAHAGPADILAVDVEGRILADLANARAMAKAFIAYVKAHDPVRLSYDIPMFGLKAGDHRPIGLYSSRGTWPGDCGANFRWVADYSGDPNRLALRLIRRGLSWTFWQYSGIGLDRDRFNGTAAQLEAFAGQTVAGGDPMTNLFPLTAHRVVDLPAGAVLQVTPGGAQHTKLGQPVTLGLLGATATHFQVADGDAGVYVARGALVPRTADLNAGR